MAKHILRLETPFTFCESVFLIKDISTYAPLIPVECAELQILPPGYGRAVVLGGLVKGFDLVLNVCTMGIMGPSSCADSCPNFPDGIYHIRYSVSPNDRVYVEYNSLRTTHAVNRLNALYCNVKLHDCLPDEQKVYQLQKLDIIRDYLLTAKILVDDQNKTTDGIEIYRYALSLMDKLKGRYRS